MDRIPFLNHNKDEHPRNEGTFIGRMWGRIVEAQGHRSHSGNERSALHHDVSMQSSPSLHERTIDWKGSLAALNFDGIKAVATQLAEECLGEEGYSVEAFQVYLELKNRIDAKDLTKAEQASLTEILEKGGFSIKRQVELLEHGGTAEIRAKAGEVIVALARLEKAPVDEIIDLVARMLYQGNPDAKQQAGMVLLEIARSENMSMENRVAAAGHLFSLGVDEHLEVAKDLLVGFAQRGSAAVKRSIFNKANSVISFGTPLGQELAGELLFELARSGDVRLINIIQVLIKNVNNQTGMHLLGIAHMEHVSIEEKIEIACEVFRFCDEVSKAQAEKLLLEIARSEHVALASRVDAVNVLLEKASEPAKIEAMYLLLELSRIPEAPMVRIMKIAHEIFKHDNTAAKSQAEALVLSIIRVGDDPLITVIEKIRMATDVLQLGSPEAKLEAEAFLLAMAQGENTPIADKVKIACDVFRLGSADAKAQARETLYLLLDHVIELQDTIDVGQKKIIIDALYAASRNQPLDAFKEKIIDYFAKHVLSDPVFSNNHKVLLNVSAAIIDGLHLHDDDERYQKALSMHLQLRGFLATNVDSGYYKGELMWLQDLTKSVSRLFQSADPAFKENLADVLQSVYYLLNCLNNNHPEAFNKGVLALNELLWEMGNMHAAQLPENFSINSLMDFIFKEAIKDLSPEEVLAIYESTDAQWKDYDSLAISAIFKGIRDCILEAAQSEIDCGEEGLINLNTRIECFGSHFQTTEATDSDKKKVGAGFFHKVYGLPYTVGHFEGEAPSQRVKAFKPIGEKGILYGISERFSEMLGLVGDSSEPIPIRTRYLERNLVVSGLDNTLEFGVIARTQPAIHEGQRGIVMELYAPNQQGAATDVPRLVLAKSTSELNTNNPSAMQAIHADPHFMRDCVSLQLIDLITGQFDRHQGNYLLLLGDHNEYLGLRGIDNDNSSGAMLKPMFIEIGGRQYYHHQVEFPQIVDKRQYDAIMALEDADIDDICSNRLTRVEVMANKERLALLKEHLKGLNAKVCVIQASDDCMHWMSSRVRDSAYTSINNRFSSYYARDYYARLQ